MIEAPFSRAASITSPSKATTLNAPGVLAEFVLGRLLDQRDALLERKQRLLAGWMPIATTTLSATASAP